MVVTARLLGLVLILFVLVTGSLTKPHLFQAHQNYHNLVLQQRKALQSTSENKNRGRKMISDGDLVKIKTAKEIGIRAYDSKKSRILVSEENHGARFVAFNQDYKGPSHHPPRNN